MTMQRCQLRGNLAMEPVQNGDVWTFLNRVKSEIQAHDELFYMHWVGVYLQPYEYSNDNFLTLKVRGIGSVYNIEEANDTIIDIIVNAAEANNLLVGGAAGFLVVEDRTKEMAQ